MNPNQTKNDAITRQEDDFAQWYTDVCKKAELMDYSSVKGFIVYLPYGYAIWEEIQNYCNKKFKEKGAQNVYLPLVIPQSLFATEKEHVEGFAPECLVAEAHRQKDALTALGGVVAHDATDGIDKGIEDAQHPDDAEDIEEQVGKGCTTSLKVGTEGCKVGCGGGSDILAHDEGYAQIDGQHTCGTEQDGDCHDGG